MPPTRPLTLGRRNWTFLGSGSGGERAARFERVLAAPVVVVIQRYIPDVGDQAAIEVSRFPAEE
jgi:hypothetical protein